MKRPCNYVWKCGDRVIAAAAIDWEMKILYLTDNTQPDVTICVDILRNCQHGFDIYRAKYQVNEVGKVGSVTARAKYAEFVWFEKPEII